MRAARLRTTLGLAAATISAVPVSAQTTSSVEVRAQASTEADVGGWRGGSAIGAALRLDRPRWGLASAVALISEADRWHPSGTLSAVVLSRVFGPLQLSASGALSRTNRAAAMHNEALADGRASLKFGRWGAWTGLSARRIDETHAPGVEAWPVLGAWQELGGAVLSLEVSPRRARVPGAFTGGPLSGPDTIFNDTLGGPASDSGLAAVVRSWSDAEARLVWARGRWAVDATLGGRFASTEMERSMWAQLQGLYALTPRLALIAAGGNAPADPVRGRERHAFATLGVRLLGSPEPRADLPAEVRPGAADFRVMPVRDQEYLVRVRVPHARTVELSADFTGWEPVALSRASADWWQATVAIAPGTHHVNIRVNGDAWTAPPGTPAVEDEFNGTVGLIVVP